MRQRAQRNWEDPIEGFIIEAPLASSEIPCKPPRLRVLLTKRHDVESWTETSNASIECLASSFTKQSRARMNVLWCLSLSIHSQEFFQAGLLLFLHICHGVSSSDNISHRDIFSYDILIRLPGVAGVRTVQWPLRVLATNPEGEICGQPGFEINCAFVPRAADEVHVLSPSQE
jgi:hypothetical protein